MTSILVPLLFQASGFLLCCRDLDIFVVFCFCRFGELSAVLDPGKPPKSDKAVILVDAARALAQLRSEAEELKDANEKLQDTIKDLKVKKSYNLGLLDELA